VRENSLYAFLAQADLVGVGLPFRTTPCRRGASKGKSSCDGIHRDASLEAEVA